jgi:hypothetical protein
MRPAQVCDRAFRGSPRRSTSEQLPQDGFDAGVRYNRRRMGSALNNVARSVGARQTCVIVFACWRRKAAPVYQFVFGHNGANGNRAAPESSARLSELAISDRTCSGEGARMENTGTSTLPHRTPVAAGR